MESCSQSRELIDLHSRVQKVKEEIIEDIDIVVPYVTRIKDHTSSTQKTTNAALEVNVIIFNFINSQFNCILHYCKFLTLKVVGIGPLLAAIFYLY